MAGISFIGSYSGIDQATIDQLMEAERAPLVGLTNKKTDITEKQDAWKDINTRLNSLFERLNVLQDKETFTSMTATSTNEEMVTISASEDAAVADYNIRIEQLATSANIIGGQVGDEIVGGEFTIKNIHGEEAKIVIEEGHSLEDIVNSINEAMVVSEGDEEKGFGVKASIIDNRLVLNSSDMGEGNIQLYGNGDGVLDSLGLDRDTRENNGGQNAKFNLNGVEIERSSNVVSDAIEGVTFNLHKTHSNGASDTINITQDTEKATKAIEDFVNQYNSIMTFIEEKLSAGDPEVPDSGGALAGDGTLMRLHSSLRSMVTSSLKNDNTTISDMSQLGVSTTDRYGKLNFDRTKLLDAMEEDSENVMNFFISTNEDGDDIGFTENLGSYVNSFISSDDKNKAIIASKTESYDRTLKDLDNQIERFNERMVRREEYYIKTFTALDVAMMEAESQMAWMQSQIQGMNAQMGAN